MANTVDSTMVEIEAGMVTDPVAIEVNRNLRVLYNTLAGQQALDRDFGIATAAPDIPTEAAKAFLTKEYVTKTQKYEPRAAVDHVEWESDKPGGNLSPKVVIRLVQH